MRIIDADDLKKAIYSDLGLGDTGNAEYQNGLQDCYNLIDNVPTISEGLYEAYCRMNDAELEHTERLSFFNSKGELVGFVKERPKGEWIDTGSGQECNVCHEIQYGYDNFRHFCANCGARMKGGADMGVEKE